MPILLIGVLKNRMLKFVCVLLGSYLHIVHIVPFANLDFNNSYTSALNKPQNVCQCKKLHF